MRRLTVGLCALCLLQTISAQAHEDIDIGIVKAGYDDQCRAVVTLKNGGRELPDSFYTGPGPFVEIHAGKTSLGRFAIGALDKDRRLRLPGRLATFYAGEGAARLSDPLKIIISVKGHWDDFNDKNNALEKAVGCRSGKGEIVGIATKPQHADLRIASIDIDGKTCQPTVTIENVNNAPLADAAWYADNGVTLVGINAETREHWFAAPLLQLDPGKKLAKANGKIVWRDRNSVRGMAKVFFGIWQVPNDPDFQNNNLEVNVPEECRDSVQLSEKKGNSD